MVFIAVMLLNHYAVSVAILLYGRMVFPTGTL